MDKVVRKTYLWVIIFYMTYVDTFLLYLRSTIFLISNFMLRLGYLQVVAGGARKTAMRQSSDPDQQPSQPDILSSSVITSPPA